MLQQLSLVSYNIQYCVNKESIISNIDKLSQEGVDLFCLQELQKIPKREFVGDKFISFLGREWKGEYLLDKKNPYLGLGLGVLWNTFSLKLIDVDEILLPKTKPFNFVERLKTRAKEPVQRGALVATFKISKKILRIVNLHLDWQGGFRQRKQQLNYIISYLKKRGNVDYEIFCGDFNTIGPTLFFKKRQRKINEILGVDFINVFPDLRWTQDLKSFDPEVKYASLHKKALRLGVNFHQKLDYVFSKGLLIKEAKMLKFEGSDHFPLFVNFAFPS
jgi:endonuclease/exonuclease/phosphatase family metal-dependent hydrolase